MRTLNYCVYVLYSVKDKNFYSGYTVNLKQRLTSHFRGNSKSTSSRRPLRLVFCEYYLSKKDALRREKYFKSNSGKRALRLMLRDSLKYFKEA